MQKISSLERLKNILKTKQLALAADQQSCHIKTALST